MMDEKQLAEVTKFVKANPEAFKEAKQWYKETDFLSKKDAWDESVVFNDWDKILFLANNLFSEDYEEACFMLYTGIIYTTDIHPTDKIIEVALKKGKQALASKNHNNDNAGGTEQKKKRRGAGERDDHVEKAYKALGNSPTIQAQHLATWINNKYGKNYWKMKPDNVMKSKPWKKHHLKKK